MAAVEKFFEEKHDRGIRTKDIDLIDISREGTLDDVISLFEIVVATMMESGTKETYIKCIMELDQKSQTAFMKIIDNGIEKRKATLEEISETKLQNTLTQYQIENSYLREEYFEIGNTIGRLEKENHDLAIQVSKN